MAKGIKFDNETIIRVIDKVSGELLLNCNHNNIELLIRTQKERENYDNKYGIVQMNKGRFVKIMENKISEMAKCLSSEAFKVAIRLLDFISIKDNCLVSSTDKKLMLKDIQKLIDISKPTANKYMKELEAKNVVAKMQCELGKCYFFNPFIARKTNDMILSVYNKFSDTKWNTDNPTTPTMIVWKDKRSKY
jgi:hypothetical protein